MKDLDWTILQLFLEVARAGGLSGAARVTGQSPATVGRHMLELEAVIGRPLFHRSQTGYRLTEDGEALQEHLREMEGGARRIETWREERAGRALVRFACGTWFAWWLSGHMAGLLAENDALQLDLVIGERRAPLAHRESDLGIRAVRPTEDNLAAVRLGMVAYAAYQATAAGPEPLPRFVAVSKPQAHSRYLMHPHADPACRLAALVSTPRAMSDLAAAGVGQAILPCFHGDREPRLRRVGPLIADLRHPQWLVMNNDDRHRSDIRLVADRITALVRREERLFDGSAATVP